MRHGHTETEISTHTHTHTHRERERERARDANQLSENFYRPSGTCASQEAK